MTDINEVESIRWSIFLCWNQKKQQKLLRLFLYSVNDGSKNANNGTLAHALRGIEWSSHYNAEIICIHWDYLNIRWYCFLSVNDHCRLHFAMFCFLGIDWLRLFVVATSSFAKYTNILIDSVLWYMRKKKTNKFRWGKPNKRDQKWHPNLGFVLSSQQS